MILEIVTQHSNNCCLGKVRAIRGANHRSHRHIASARLRSKRQLSVVSCQLSVVRVRGSVVDGLPAC